MPRTSSNDGAASGSDLPSVDLRGLGSAEARARAFQAFFKIKPGQRAVLLSNTPEVEKELLKWIGETGHRLVRQEQVAENGGMMTRFELIKMEARR